MSSQVSLQKKDGGRREMASMTKPQPLLAFKMEGAIGQGMPWKLLEAGNEKKMNSLPSLQ